MSQLARSLTLTYSVGDYGVLVYSGSYDIYQFKIDYNIYE